MSGSNELFWKKVSKMNREKLESYSKITEGDRRLAVKEGEVPRI